MHLRFATYRQFSRLVGDFEDKRFSPSRIEFAAFHC